MRNTAYVLAACLLLSTACVEQADIVSNAAPEKTQPAQAPEVVSPEAVETDATEAVSSLTEETEASEISESASSEAAGPDFESKVEAAKLSSELATELINLDGNNRLNIPVKVVVPTYVPEGFAVTEVVYDDDRAGPFYEIQYLNTATNECFEITAASGGFGGPTGGFEQLIEIDSNALGEVDPKD